MLQNQNDRLREAHEMLYGFCRPQNITQALSIYYEEAEVNNNIQACNAIGQIFLEGKFFPKDLKKAFQYYEKSAFSNDSEGQYRIGNFLFNGIIDGQALSGGRLDNRDKELSESVSYYQKSSEQGHLEALTELGQIFEYGLKSRIQSDQDIVPPDLEQAEFYYQQAKKVRFPRATCLLGLFYLNNPGYKEKVFGDNTRKAIKYFELALDLGHSKAYYYLAQCYEKGSIDINVNIEKAKHFYKQGALRGEQECKIHYMYYIMTDATNKNKQEDYLKAYNYFRNIIVTDPQIAVTYFYLGHLYEYGYGVSKDPRIAQSFYFKGAKHGNSDSMNKLGDFYHSGYGVPKNSQEAMRWYQQSADLNNTQAMINLGTMYEDGIDGVIQDTAKAFHFYEQASQQDCPMAYFLIGQMYQNGRYVNKDKKQAIDCYKKSAINGCQQARNILEQLKIPMIYENQMQKNYKNLEETNGFQSAFEKMTSIAPKQTPPMISNVLLVQIGKKSNQILQSKLEKQQKIGDQQYQSILMPQWTQQIQKEK